MLNARVTSIQFGKNCVDGWGEKCIYLANFLFLFFVENFVVSLFGGQFKFYV